MKFSIQKSRLFADSVLDTDYVLEYTVDWIKANLSPEEVFDESDLAEWAVNNGYKLEDDELI